MPTRGSLTHIVPRPVVEYTVGARRGEGSQPDYVFLSLRGEEVGMSPDAAEELAVQLRSFAIEVRNGGRLDGDESA
jgi:hypothetical protein